MRVALLACSTGRSARWTSTSPTAPPPEAAYFAELIELLERDRARGRRRTAGVIGRARAADLDARARRRIALRALRRGRLPPRRHAGGGRRQRHASWPARGVAYITLAHLFWRRVATNAPALPFLPDRALQPASSRSRAPALDRARRGRGARDVRRNGCWSTSAHMRDDAIDETFALLEALDARPAATRRLPGDRLARGLPLRRPEVQPLRRHDRARSPPAAASSG